MLNNKILKMLIVVKILFSENKFIGF